MKASKTSARAAELAAGYSRAQHATNVVCLVLFGALATYCVYRVVAAASAGDGWRLASATVLGLLGADLLTGIVHWACDSWGKPESWLFGKVFIRSFREHHVDERAITRHGFVQTNGEQTMAGLPMLGGLLFIAPTPGDGTTLFWFTTGLNVFFWTVAANQLHKWAHQERAPAIVEALMRARLVIGRRTHRVHHTVPYTTYYCMVTGWMNAPLHHLRFFRALEWLIHKATGALPREDDLGREAALELLRGEAPGTDPAKILAEP